MNDVENKKKFWIGVLANDDESSPAEFVSDAVKHPNHYQGRYGMEAIDVVKEFSACPEYEEGFYWGNAIKYMLRFHKKNGVEDLKKARQNLDWLIEVLEGETDGLDS